MWRITNDLWDSWDNIMEMFYIMKFVICGNGKILEAWIR